MNSTGKCEQGRGMSEKGHLFISRGQPLVHIADGKGRRPKDERKGHLLLDYNSQGVLVTRYAHPPNPHNKIYRVLT